MTHFVSGMGVVGLRPARINRCSDEPTTIGHGATGNVFGYFIMYAADLRPLLTMQPFHPALASTQCAKLQACTLCHQPAFQDRVTVACILLLACSQHIVMMLKGCAVMLCRYHLHQQSSITETSLYNFMLVAYKLEQYINAYSHQLELFIAACNRAIGFMLKSCAGMLHGHKVHQQSRVTKKSPCSISGL